MGSATSRKRLRVRLKATDGPSLARTFGTNLQETGAFVPRLTKVEEGDAVRLELTYADGTLALAGDGVVELKTPRGAELELEWDDDAWPLLLEVLSSVVPSSDPEVAPLPDLDRRSASADALERAFSSAMTSTDAMDPRPAPDLPAPRRVDSTAKAASTFDVPDAGNWDEPSPWSEEPTAFMETPGVPAPVDEQDASPWEDEDAATMLLDEPEPEPEPEPELPSFHDGRAIADKIPTDDVLSFSTDDLAASADLAVSGDVFSSGDVPGTTSSTQRPTPNLVTEEVDVSQVLDEMPEDDEPITLDTEADALPQGLMAPPIVGALDLPLASVSAVDLVSDLMGPGREPTPHPDPIDVALLVHAQDDATKQPSTEYSSTSDETVRPPADDLAAWDERTGRAPGEVTPLARIELVRLETERIRTGEVKPLYDEPLNETAIPSKRDRRFVKPRGRHVLGIDVGGAFVRTAIIQDEARILQTPSGLDGVPSAVVIEPGGKTTVGEPALGKLVRYPGVYGTKQLLGRTPAADLATKTADWLPYKVAAGDEGEVAATLGPHRISLEEITALLLKEARRAGDLQLEDRSNRAVLTCPSSYGVRQRRALRTAAELAGIVPARVVSGGLAVAVFHTNGRANESTRLMIVDFGASHFDVSVVEVGAGAYRVEASSCHADLGGVEFDRLLASGLAKEVERLVQQPLDLAHDTMIRLLLGAEGAKRKLSNEAMATVSIDHPLAGEEASFNLEIDLDRSRLHSVVGRLVDRALAIVEQMRDRVGGVDQIVGVGGQMRDPAIRSKMETALGSSFVVVEPERAAALGAARIGRAIADSAALTLHERTPTALGFIGPQGAPEPLLTANAPCPNAGVRAWPVIDAASQLCVVYEGLDAIEPICRIHVGDGERTPPFDAALKLTLDDSMELVVEAVDRATGQALTTRLVPLGRPLPPRVELLPAAEVPTGIIGWIKRKLGGS